MMRGEKRTQMPLVTTIEHLNPGDNKIFVMCDASDWRTGTTLSFGPTRESMMYTINWLIASHWELASAIRDISKKY